MPGKKISDLDVYDDVNSDKSRKNLYEVSKNTGTYASPTYATNGSRKITQEQLREELNIKEYLVRDFIVVGSGGTIVEDKVNAIIVTANETFTLPTASSSNYGKSIVIANRCDYTVTINGIVNGSSIKLTNFNEVIQLSCLFDGVSTYGWWLVSDAINDKICTNRVILNTNTYTAKHNDSIKADALSIGSDVDITIPTAGIEGRLIYVYYPTGSPTAYVVNLIGGFSATLVQLDYFLIRDNGTYWEAISTSQNVAVTPDLDAVTTVGSTTTNDITVGSATLSNTTVSTLPFIDSAKKIISATGALLGTWFQTLTADTNPVDADTIVVNDSVNSFEAKKTTLLQLWSNYIKTKADSVYLLLTGGTLTGALNYPSFTTLASASTTNIGGVNNNYIEITGTTNITSFGTSSAGVVRILRFTGILTISHNGISLILPNGTDVTTKANDIIEMTSLGSGNWICTSITQGSLGNYVDLSTSQTITGQKTFSRDTGSPTTGTATGTIITQLDCARIINSGKYIFYVSGDNVSIGKNAGHGSASLCTSIGASAGNWSMSGQQNTLFGYQAGNVLSSGSYNTIAGSAAGQSLTTGGYNVYSGFGAGYGAGGANNNNVYLGALSGDNKTESFRLRIHSATAFSSVPIIYGEFDNRVLRFDVNSLSIGSTNANARSQLHLQSTSKGFLPNVLTTAQRDAVSWVAGDAGMIIYNSTTNKHQGWNGTTWNDMY